MNTHPPYLTEAQVAMLMRDLHKSRILTLDGAAYVAQWDVRAMLTRVFGFGRWSLELNEPTTLVYEDRAPLKSGKDGVTVAYKASVHLTVCAPNGEPIASYDGSSVGTCPPQPLFKRGDAHDTAMKVAESNALKRAAMNLGTQFGMSLYNSGSMVDVIRVCLVPGVKVDAADEAPHVTVEVTADEDLTPGGES